MSTRSSLSLLHSVFVATSLAAAVAVLAACSGSSSERCTPGESSECACAGGGTGAQVCASDGKSFGACSCSSESGPLNNPLDEERDASVTAAPGHVDASVDPVGNGAPCSQASDCPSLTCGCHDGSETAYQGCNNGQCVTECPSDDIGTGQSCLVPSGCFCFSSGCAFGTQTCCATTPTLDSSRACSTDCDCISGDCADGYCF